jgi:GGDEF domain-containing protein
MGGDEFTVLFLADACHLAALQQALQTATAGWKGQYSVKLSLAVGYAAQAEFPEMPIDKLAKIADQRMYENKRKYYEETGHDRRNAKAGTQR